MSMDKLSLVLVWIESGYQVDGFSSRVSWHESKVRDDGRGTLGEYRALISWFGLFHIVKIISPSSKKKTPGHGTWMK